MTTVAVELDPLGLANEPVVVVPGPPSVAVIGGPSEPVAEAKVTLLLVAESPPPVAVEVHFIVPDPEWRAGLEANDVQLRLLAWKLTTDLKEPPVMEVLPP
jgi:hypothetical protein